MSSNTTKFFVSHISEEAEIAALMKRSLEEDFLGLVKFFTSSDMGSIIGGDFWLTAVENAMNEAAGVIVLCSRASIQRPWVQFEVGAAWMKNIPIVPVCHSELKPADLKVPLSLREGVELGTARGLEKLYRSVANTAHMPNVPPRRNEQKLLQDIAALEKAFRQTQVQQFERHLDIIIPPPGRLDQPVIPGTAAIESNEASLRLFGLLPGSDWTWADIVKAANKRKDTRWVSELQRCVCAASNNELFRSVQAIYHAEIGSSFQPQLAKKESLSTGACRFHVHFVETVVAPLSEVQNDFGLLATLLRLGLRFRYEVIERYQGAAARRDIEDAVRQLRCAIEVIECDALSRGAENIDRQAVVALFERPEEQEEVGELQELWDSERARLFRDNPPLTLPELAEVVGNLRYMNGRFMSLSTRRYHEMVTRRWGNSTGIRQPVSRSADSPGAPG